MGVPLVGVGPGAAVVEGATEVEDGEDEEDA
jgi:hypothetical protein